LYQQTSLFDLSSFRKIYLPLGRSTWRQIYLATDRQACLTLGRFTLLQEGEARRETPSPSRLHRNALRCIEPVEMRCIEPVEMRCIEPVEMRCIEPVEMSEQ